MHNRAPSFVCNHWETDISFAARLQLVGFIAHPNAQIRVLAIQNLVPYSTAEPAIFKTEELKPVKHLKWLVRDHPVSLVDSRLEILLLTLTVC